MKTLLFTLILCLISLFPLNAQAQDQLNSLVQAGIGLHDQGKYDEAIEKYQQALKIDPKSAYATYELALTLFQSKRYEAAIEQGKKVIAWNGNYALESYNLVGSAQDMAGKPADAIKTYKKGRKAFPEYHLLAYNLALTYFNQKDLKKAELAAMDAIKLKKSHASSHYLLAQLQIRQGNRMKAILAQYYALYQEPNSRRTDAQYKLLNDMLMKGVSKTGPANININIAPSDKKDPYSGPDMMMGIMAASIYLEKNEGKNEVELFAQLTSLYLSVMESNKLPKDMYTTLYLDFLKNLNTAGHTDAFSYYISKASHTEAVTKWETENDNLVQAFSSWRLKQ